MKREQQRAEKARRVADKAEAHRVECETSGSPLVRGFYVIQQMELSPEQTMAAQLDLIFLNARRGSL